MENSIEYYTKEEIDMIDKFKRITGDSMDDDDIYDVLQKHKFNEKKVKEEIFDTLHKLKVKGEDYQWNMVKKDKTQNPHKTKKPYNSKYIASNANTKKNEIPIKPDNPNPNSIPYNNISVPLINNSNYKLPLNPYFQPPKDGSLINKKFPIEEFNKAFVNMMKNSNFKNFDEAKFMANINSNVMNIDKEEVKEKKENILDKIIPDEKKITKRILTNSNFNNNNTKGDVKPKVNTNINVNANVKAQTIETISVNNNKIANNTDEQVKKELNIEPPKEKPKNAKCINFLDSVFNKTAVKNNIIEKKDIKIDTIDTNIQQENKKATDKIGSNEELIEIDQNKENISENNSNSLHNHNDDQNNFDGISSPTQSINNSKHKLSTNDNDKLLNKEKENVKLMNKGEFRISNNTANQVPSQIEHIEKLEFKSHEENKTHTNGSNNKLEIEVINRQSIWNIDSHDAIDLLSNKTISNNNNDNFNINSQINYNQMYNQNPYTSNNMFFNNNIIDKGIPERNTYDLSDLNSLNNQNNKDLINHMHNQSERVNINNIQSVEQQFKEDIILSKKSSIKPQSIIVVTPFSQDLEHNFKQDDDNRKDIEINITSEKEREEEEEGELNTKIFEDTEVDNTESFEILTTVKPGDKENIYSGSFPPYQSTFHKIKLKLAHSFTLYSQLDPYKQQLMDSFGVDKKTLEAMIVNTMNQIYMQNNNYNSPNQTPHPEFLNYNMPMSNYNNNNIHRINNDNNTSLKNNMNMNQFNMGSQNNLPDGGMNGIMNINNNNNNNIKNKNNYNNMNLSGNYNNNYPSESNNSNLNNYSMDNNFFNMNNNMNNNQNMMGMNMMNNSNINNHINPTTHKLNSNMNNIIELPNPNNTSINNINNTMNTHNNMNSNLGKMNMKNNMNIINSQDHFRPANSNTNMNPLINNINKSVPNTFNKNISNNVNNSNTMNSNINNRFNNTTHTTNLPESMRMMTSNMNPNLNNSQNFGNFGNNNGISPTYNSYMNNNSNQSQNRNNINNMGMFSKPYMY